MPSSQVHRKSSDFVQKNIINVTSCLNNNSIYMSISALHHRFPLKHCMWFDRVIAAVLGARDLSWGLACPFHCGGSSVWPFVAGLGFGTFCGFGLCIYLLILFRSPLVAAPSVLTPEAQPSNIIRRHSRLSGYLHE